MLIYIRCPLNLKHLGLDIKADKYSIRKIELFKLFNLTECKLYITTKRGMIAMYELCASMMCASLIIYPGSKNAGRSRIDSFHIDMDGQFVPNFGMDFRIWHISGKQPKKVEVHLMIKSLTATWIFSSGTRSITYTYILEADYHPSTTLQHIIESGIVPV